jgi:hypothetical protein
MKKIFTNRWFIWAIVFIAVAGVVFWKLWFFNSRHDLQNEAIDKQIENLSSNNQEQANEELKVEDTNEINQKEYSLQSYSLEDSPIYGELEDKCYDSYWTKLGLKDVRLVRKDGEILIPSLLQIIFSTDEKKSTCSTQVGLFSAPANEKYLYLQTRRAGPYESPNGGLNGMFRLNLSNLTIKRLSISNFVESFDLNYGIIADTYRLLPDGNRLIKWNMDGVYLINLETDSKTVLYTVPENQWLISNINTSIDWGSSAYYNVEVNDKTIVISVYEKTELEDVDVELLEGYKRNGADIKQNLAEQITLPIPDEK